jgi:hypothetical protein
VDSGKKLRFSMSTHIAGVRYCAGRTACHNTVNVRTQAGRTISV